MRTILVRRLDAPVATLALAGAFYLGLCGLRLARVDWDASYFVVAGSQLTIAEELPPGIRVRHPVGYDGQFYYRLALDPFTSLASDHGIRLDNPPYRQQRLLYPFLVWLASGFGQPRVALWMMIGVNVVALLAIGWLAGRWAQSFGRHALAGLAMALYPGFLLSLSRDTTEIVEAAFLLSGFLLIRRGRPYAATAGLALAVLARETAFFAVLGLGVAWLVDRSRVVRWHNVAIPLLVGASLQLALWANWGGLPAIQNQQAFSRPFEALETFFSSTRSALGDELGRTWLAEGGFLIALYFAVAYALWRSRAAPHEKAACTVYLGLATVLSTDFWREDWGFLRAHTELFLLGSILLLACTPKIHRPVFAASIGLSLLLAENLVRTLR